MRRFYGCWIEHSLRGSKQTGMSEPHRSIHCQPWYESVSGGQFGLAFCSAKPSRTVRLISDM